MQEINQQVSKQVWTNVGENLWRLESSGIYYAILKRGRKQYRRSLKTSDRALAKQRLREFQDGVSRLSTTEDGSDSFDQMADRWLTTVQHSMKESTLARRKTCLKALSPFFRDLSIRNIKARHCEEWVSKRGSKIAGQTFAHELDTMRGVFNFAVSQGVILNNPARDIKRKRIDRKKPMVPSRDQFQNLISQIRESDGRPSSQAVAKNGADFIELLAYSGMRSDEARNLKWEHVYLDRGFFTVTGGEKGTKNSEVRTVPISEDLKKLLTRIHSDTNPIPQDFVVKIKSAKTCIQTACRKLGLPHFTHHGFRHFFATTCIEANVDIPTVARWLGHKDGGKLLMDTYGHLRPDHSFAQMKRVSFGTQQQPENIVKWESQLS